jgi:predicted nucleotidyltransferase
MILTIEEITQRLTPVFEQNGVTKAILFGSYAKGEATEESDVDLAVETEPHIKGLKFVAICKPISHVLGKEADVLYVKTLMRNERVYANVLKTGRVIYERK